MFDVLPDPTQSLPFKAFLVLTCLVRFDEDDEDDEDEDDDDEKALVLLACSCFIFCSDLFESATVFIPLAALLWSIFETELGCFIFL